LDLKPNVQTACSKLKNNNMPPSCHTSGGIGLAFLSILILGVASEPNLYTAKELGALQQVNLYFLKIKIQSSKKWLL